IKAEDLNAVLVGIRRDEHGIRAKERYFSPRDKEFKWDYKNQPAELWNQYKSTTKEDNHIRVHPLLHWTEIDIWKYIKRENIPINELYFAKNGKRFRSLGCMPATKPIDSNADDVDKIITEIENSKTSERSGRAQDKEMTYTMQKLRSLGYM
ncbi:MAG: phosphoadenosine phosphosulfate reductase family protein, partial [Candidatus Diapherotrites archaeon]|nr:phosphoadenosine phosphosulfate reductase family protein [Candidatus Diapherotrites archaeon]